MKKKYFFDHIQKCGGSALEEIFKMILGKENVTEKLQIDAKNAMELYSNASDMICGHFWFHPKYKFRPDCYYLTILRSPIDRAVSSYFYSKHDLPTLGSIKYVQLAKNYNPEEFFFVMRLKLMKGFPNIMTKHFLQATWDGIAELTEHNQLDLAKKSLDHYDLVGVYHQFTDFVDILCYECGWLPVKEIPRINTTRNRQKVSEVDPKIIRRLEELNQLDLALYDYATQLFNEKKRQVLHECIERRHQELNALTPLI
jgi:hypothetical protein